MLRLFASFGFAVLAGCSSSDSQAPASNNLGADAQAEPAPDASAADSDQPETAADAGPDTVVPDGQSEAGDEPCKLAKPYSSSNATCNSCAEQNCCELINICFADPACDDTYVNCILACALMSDEDAGDAGMALCMADCASQAPEGKKEFDSLSSCADSKCAAECK